MNVQGNAYEEQITVGESYFAKDSIESRMLVYFQFLYMPVGVTLYWNPYKASHVTGHSLNYLIWNSKVLFGDDTLHCNDLNQCYFYLVIEVC